MRTLGLLLFLTGCSASKASLPCPSEGGAVWRELRTQHFLVKSDASSENAREEAMELEKLYAGLTSTIFVGTSYYGRAGVPPLEVVMMHDGGELKRYVGPDVRGRFVRGVPADAERYPLVMLTTTDDEAARILLHETTHSLIDTALGDMPAWFHEGMARYAETLTLAPGVVRVGAPPFGHAWRSLPSVSALVRMDAEAFYTSNPRETDMNYSASWLLVHMLRHAPRYRVRFDAFVEQVAEGTDLDEAFKVFQTKSDIEEDFHAYSQKATFEALDFPWTPPSVTVQDERALSDAEVHLLRARLLSTRAGTREALDAELAEARKHEPSSRAVPLMRAALEDIPQQRLVAAEEILRTDPENVQALYLAARASSDIARGQEKRSYYCGELRERARSTVERAQVALCLAAEGHMKTALKIIERVTDEDPSNRFCAGAHAAIRRLNKEEAAAEMWERRASRSH